MELENQVVPAAPQPEAVDPVEVETLADGFGADDPGESDGDPSEAPAYEPNFKFNVLDRQEEFPEEFRQYIKDKGTEDRFRDVFERAYGVDVLKNDRQVLREHNQTIGGELGKYKENYQLLGQMIQSKDLDNFHKQWGITEEQLVDHIMAKARMSDPELPPEQRQYMQEQQQIRSQNAQLQYQNQQLLAQRQNDVLMQATTDLNESLSQPDVARTAYEYDTRVGKPGAFKAEVIRLGAYHESQRNALSASQVIREFQNMIGVAPAAIGQPAPFQPQYQPPAQQPWAGQPIQAPTAQALHPHQKPVIPIPRGGGGQSPASVAPRSIADLRKLGRELNT